jgi:hypothetical protein
LVGAWGDCQSPGDVWALHHCDSIIALCDKLVNQTTLTENWTPLHFFSMFHPTLSWNLRWKNSSERLNSIRNMTASERSRRRLTKDGSTAMRRSARSAESWVVTPRHSELAWGLAQHGSTKLKKD